MQDRNPERNKPTRLGRFSRTASFWILLFLIPVLIIQIFNDPQRQDAAELTYTVFSQQLEHNNLAEVVIVGGKRVEGSLKQPIPVEDRMVREFWTLLPIENSESLVESLEARGVPIAAEPETQPWWTTLISILPWVLIIGFWFFMLRQMQAGGSKARCSVSSIRSS